jgi:thioredoxin reductase
VREQAIGVLATTPHAVHMAQLFRQLTSDVVLFAHTGPELSAEQREQLAARDIRIVAGEVAGLEIVNDRLTGVRLRDGTVVPRQALVVARSKILASLGLHPTPHPFGEHMAADATGKTAVPGVWVAGNIADLSATVIAAAAGGVVAGGAINADLVAEDVAQCRIRFERGVAVSRAEA